MNITVFGASGGIGTHLVSLAAQRGHQVRAIYRTTPQDPPPAQAEILTTEDIFDPGFAAEAIRGADVVAAAVGPNFATRHNPRTTMTSPPDLHQRLASTLVTAVKDSAAPASGLDWHALRPVKLTDGPLTGQVQASDRFAMRPSPAPTSPGRSSPSPKTPPLAGHGPRSSPAAPAGNPARPGPGTSNCPPGKPPR